MKSFFGVLVYVNGYWRYAWLNIVFNIFSVVFNLLSIVTVMPLLDLLFLKSTADLHQIIAKGVPAMNSPSSLLNRVNYEIAELVLGAENVNAGKMKALIFICFAAIIFIFCKSFFRYLAMFSLAAIRNGVVRDFRNKLYDKALRLPLSFYSNERKGDIMSRMQNDVQEVEWSIMSSLEMIFREPVTIVGMLVWLTWMSPELTLFVVAATPIVGGLLALVSKTLRKTSLLAKQKLGLLTSLMEEMLGGLRVIKGFNGEKNSSGRFRKVNEQYTKISIRNYRRMDLASPLSEFLIVCIMAVVIYYGGRLVLYGDGTLPPAQFFGYIAIFSQLITPVRQFTQAYNNVQKGLASMERINGILHAEETISDPEKPKKLGTFSREIEYANASFAYSKGDVGWAIRNINLKIEKGKTIALVGQSGSGKTTLADMLPRFYDVSDGKITIDGIDIRDLRMNDLRSLMGIVSQESILFNDTIFNNIAFGVEGVTKEQVIAAAKVANAHDFIMEMSEGYETNIGDRGVKMSGGQRQRISIARAVLKNPPILILDEATSALDTESERLVQDALNKLMQNRTSVIIAHRLSTIQHADEIIVLQKGEIIERGTHQELLQKNGTYKKLYDLQIFV
ncbi:MAG: ATP-binding cassette, subfamily B, bacterial MsbA [Bacteroidetes bacterium]|nr:MAG: ATP-binding cassette, subfamily B, bacterial MsbA [Bacteroidota bacterium]